ncbi:hypothetical protein ACJX0J_032151, partial [Zea mays]
HILEVWWVASFGPHRGHIVHRKRVALYKGAIGWVATTLLDITHDKIFTFTFCMHLICGQFCNEISDKQGILISDKLANRIAVELFVVIKLSIYANLIIGLYDVILKTIKVGEATSKFNYRISISIHIDVGIFGIPNYQYTYIISIFCANGGLIQISPWMAQREGGGGGSKHI